MYMNMETAAKLETSTWMEVWIRLQTYFQDLLDCLPKDQIILFRGEKDFDTQRPIKSRLCRYLEDQDIYSAPERTLQADPAIYNFWQDTISREAAAYLPEMDAGAMVRGAGTVTSSVNNIGPKPNWHPESATPMMRSLLVEMQHYNIPTNLLDCTTDMAVALFFACHKSLDQDGCIKFIRIFSNKYYEGEFVLVPSIDKMRPHAQRSALLYLSRGKIDQEERGVDSFKVEACYKKYLLEYLDRAFGINKYTMFPDIEGAAMDERFQDVPSGSTRQVGQTVVAAEPV